MPVSSHVRYGKKKYLVQIFIKWRFEVQSYFGQLHNHNLNVSEPIERIFFFCHRIIDFSLIRNLFYPNVYVRLIIYKYCIPE